MQRLSYRHKATALRAVPPKGALIIKNVLQNAIIDAQQLHTRSRACFSAKNVVQSAYVCRQAHMGTSKRALATITGRQSEEDQNALELMVSVYSNKIFYRQ